MKFIELVEKVLTEASGLSKAGVDKNAVKAFHNAMAGNKDRGYISVLKHDTKWSDVKNKSEAKLKINQLNRNAILGVDKKNGEHLLVINSNSNSKTGFRLYKYNPDTKGVETFVDLTAAKALTMFTVHHKLMFSPDTAPSDEKYEKRAEDLKSARRWMDRSDIETYAKAFAPIFVDLSKDLLDKLSKEIIENPHTDSPLGFRYFSDITSYAVSLAKMADALSGKDENKKERAVGIMFDTLYNLGFITFEDLDNIDPGAVRNLVANGLKFFKDKDKVYNAMKKGDLRSFSSVYLG
jgi:hypothetical protein